MFEVVAQPVSQLGVPIAGTVLALWVVGMVRGELGELVRLGARVGRQADAPAGRGQIFRIGLPVQRHGETM